MINTAPQMRINVRGANCMDIQKIISDVLEKLQNDNDLLAKFRESPAKTIEGIIGIDLPDEQIDAVAKGVMAKISLDEVAGQASALIGKFGGILGKK